MTKILKGDPRLRRQAALAGALVLVAGAAALPYLAAELRAAAALLAESPLLAHRRFLRLAGVVLGLLASAAVGLGVFWLQRAWRAWRSGELPPPGSRLLHDRPVITGRRARRRAALLIALGLLAIAAGVAVPAIVLGRFERTLGEARERALDWHLSTGDEPPAEAPPPPR